MALDTAGDASGPAPATPSSLGGTLLLGLAVLPYLILLATLPAAGTFPNEGGGEARISEGFQELLAYTMGVVVMLLLTLTLWRGARTGVFAYWARQTMWLVVPAAAFAMIFAMGQAFEQPGPLSILPPELLPPALAAYALFGCQPALSRWLAQSWAGANADAIGIGLIAALAAAAIPLCVIDASTWPARLERHHAEQAAEEAASAVAAARRDEELRARFARLGPDSSLRDYLEVQSWYLSGVDIIAGAREVKSRQSDAVGLLNDGKILDLSDLWRLDLEATPALCESYGRGFKATFGRGEVYRGSAYLNLLESQFPNLRFLRGGGCDLDRALREVDGQLVWMLESKDPSGASSDDYAAYYSRFGVGRETVVAMRGKLGEFRGAR